MPATTAAASEPLAAHLRSVKQGFRSHDLGNNFLAQNAWSSLFDLVLIGTGCHRARLAPSFQIVTRIALSGRHRAFYQILCRNLMCIMMRTFVQVLSEAYLRRGCTTSSPRSIDSIHLALGNAFQRLRVPILAQSPSSRELYFSTVSFLAEDL